MTQHYVKKLGRLGRWHRVLPVAETHTKVSTWCGRQFNTEHCTVTDQAPPINQDCGHCYNFYRWHQQRQQKESA